MALENAQYLAQLIAANPADTDPAAMGAAQIRLLKAALLATFPNLNGAVTGSAAQINAVTGLMAEGGMTIQAPTDAASVTAGTGASLTLLGQSSGSNYQLGITGANFTLGYAASGVTSYTTALTYSSSSNIMNLTGLGPDVQVNGNSVQVPVGSVIMYSGAVANLPSNWHLCDGTAGTPDLRDQFIIGAGKSYTTGQTGGSNTLTLTTANLPPHTHNVNDPSHTHNAGVYDPSHTHGVDDGGHSHAINTISPAARNGGTTTGAVLSFNNAELQTIANANTLNYNNANTNNGQGNDGNSWEDPGVSGSGYFYNGTFQTNNSGTGVSIYGSTTGISVSNAWATTGITLQATGSGAAFASLPPYYALAFIMRIK